MHRPPAYKRDCQQNSCGESQPRSDGGGRKRTKRNDVRGLLRWFEPLGPKLCRQPGQRVRRRSEAPAGAGSCRFELRCDDDAQRTMMASSRCCWMSLMSAADSSPSMNASSLSGWRCPVLWIVSVIGFPETVSARVGEARGVRGICVRSRCRWGHRRQVLSLCTSSLPHRREEEPRGEAAEADRELR
jgi:hypothetical protein